MISFVQPSRPGRKQKLNGITCPKYGNAKARVRRTRSDRPGLIRRTRQCRDCGEQMKTYEMIVVGSET